MGKTAVWVLVITVAISFAAAAWAEDFGSIPVGGGDVNGSDESAVQDFSSGDGWQPAGQAMSMSATAVPSVEDVTVVTNILEQPDAMLTNGFSLRASEYVLKTEKEDSDSIEVKTSQGETRFVEKSQVWLRGTNLIEAPGLGMSDLLPGVEPYLGGQGFDHYAIRVDNLYETKFSHDDQAWDDPIFMAGSGVVLGAVGSGYKSPSGNFLGADERDIYVFDSVSIPLPDKTVNVPVMTTFDKVNKNRDYKAIDRGAFAIANSGWKHIHGENAYTQVTLQDGSKGVVSLDTISNNPSSGKISVTDDVGNVWYVKDSDIDKSSEMLFKFSI
jgi:hypothetical protein